MLLLPKEVSCDCSHGVTIVFTCFGWLNHIVCSNLDKEDLYSPICFSKFECLIDNNLEIDFLIVGEYKYARLLSDMVVFCFFQNITISSDDVNGNIHYYFPPGKHKIVSLDDDCISAIEIPWDDDRK